MLKPDVPQGTVHTFWLDSQVLRGNPWGDPTRRRIDVYLPPGVNLDSDKKYPVLYDLVGYTSGGPKHTAYKNFGENVPERMNRLLANGDTKPAIIVFPDCFTKLGGNQYINSASVGPWADFLIQEVIPFVEERTPVLAGREHRGLFGKSSGGYAAIVHGMRYADVWNALACHSGDMYFDFCYRTDFPNVLDTLAKHDRSIPKFIEYFHNAESVSGDDFHALMAIAMAATYDPNEENPADIRLPLDLYTGEFDEERWAHWLEHDPIHLVDELGDNLRDLDLVFIDCGDEDQYHMVYGSRILHNKLEQMEINHLYEEFNDNHSSIDYRMDRSIPLLVDALTPFES
ncbi:MAG: enterochelin esterase [Candidatus Marinimicrobia bacterium]|nr:enterochelin esterase [Candidatus Neomarinimicrobiota bacterium]MCF7828650.1 enterochelin esterase [Candidatus Neomarinimicrobiota bacterium]MCF7880391.1 enterochelin esterase [Candidatus Neomarinimicrobiota bacterium]